MTKMGVLKIKNGQCTVFSWNCHFLKVDLTIRCLTLLEIKVKKNKHLNYQGIFFFLVFFLKKQLKKPRTDQSAANQTTRFGKLIIKNVANNHGWPQTRRNSKQMILHDVTWICFTIQG